MSFIKNEMTGVTNIEKNVNNMSPANVLKRGYSITLLDGKALKNIQDVQEGEILNTIVFEGSISSIVKSTDKQTNHE